MTYFYNLSMRIPIEIIVSRLHLIILPYMITSFRVFFVTLNFLHNYKKNYLILFAYERV